MKTYISILRGINVSGQKKILMKDLKELYESMGFENVLTYIQSGNVLFKYKSISDRKLSKMISSEIEKKYGFTVPVIIRSIEEWEEIISSNPFSKRNIIDMDRIYITILEEVPSKEQIEGLRQISFPPEEFEIKGKEIYLYCPKGYGEAKLSNNFFENKLKVKATTRNLKTIQKLSELSSNL